jgi:hypothetical protein
MLDELAMSTSFRLFWPALVATLAAPLYMFLNNRMPELLGGFEQMLEGLFYPGLAVACLISSVWLSRSLTVWVRVAYLVATGAVVIGVCVFFSGRLIHWL